jgi:endonuclease/exonuclease/phosphatase family metal-dependent hydrolase
VATAGAAPKTGNHLFFRVTARNVTRSDSTTREFGKLRAVAPKAVAVKSGGKAIRVGSYNILSSKASNGRPWKQRAPEVASTIASHHPDVVALQELSPGRADGKSGGPTKAVPRQTDSLEAALKKKGAGKYQLTRNQSYVLPGTKHGNQGARILYNTKVLSLVTKCPEMTKRRHYNTSCSFNLPYGAGEGKADQRSAAYAEFKYKSNGKKFLFLSVHLDHRQSSNVSTLKKYNKVRGDQMKVIVAKVAKLRHHNEPVIIAGDFNSWQNNKAGDAPHEYLASHGYYDTAAAKTRINDQYDTYNDLWKTVVAGAQGYGNRIDSIMVKGTAGSNRYENIMNRVDSTRASDHNMVITDFRLWN